MSSTDDVDSKEMSYDLLKKITDDFSEERFVNEGTFGRVYKGTLENGKPVAVKVLRDMAALDDNAFRNEFQNAVRLKHKNIVQLLGYCNDPEEIKVKCDDGTEIAAQKLHKALCFEYVDNGGLDGYISDENQGLEWHVRFKIIQGICEGLKHLRLGLEKPLWHLDLKPENILLDREMTPKIADFGIARLVMDDQKTRMTISSVGTCGYWPPEFVRFQLISEAFDIFSLGVIITKIMIGTEAYHECATMQPRKFVKHVHNKWKKKLEETMKPRAVELYCQQVKVSIEIASKCLTEDRKQRPGVQDIVVILNETAAMTIIPTEIQPKGGGEPSRPSYTERCSNRPAEIPEPIPLSLLMDITNNFSEERELDTGSIGTVYKGYKDGKAIVVKKSSALNSQLNHDMMTRLFNVNHENIIKFLGYCDDKNDKLVRLPSGKYINVEDRTVALCFEYIGNGSLKDHISISDEESEPYEWWTYYKIIKGICEGLYYLHMELNMSHLKLTPDNILLDMNMVPKLDFGSARITNAANHTAAVLRCIDKKYVPPEFTTKQVISTKYDIYSLGVIMLEIMTETIGSKWDNTRPNNKKFIDHVLGEWRKRLAATLMKPRSLKGYWQQVKKCMEIAFNCLERDMSRRPDIGDIILMLKETEARVDGDLLDIHPMDMWFLVRPKKHVSCLLQLLNKDDDDPVAFRLQSKSPNSNLTKLPLCGVVPPRCTYTIVLTRSKQPQPPPSYSSERILLQGMVLSHNNLDQASVVKEYDNLFVKAEERADNEVQKIILNSIHGPPTEETPSKLSQQDIEIIATQNSRQVKSIELHPEKPWIMTIHHAGNLRIWSYETMEILNFFEVPDDPVYVAKFITEDEWIVAGDGNGHIHVSSYEGSGEATSFEAHSSGIISLAVHPKDSYVLSSSHDDHLIKLWHWDPYWDFDKSWECKATFEGHSDKVSHVLFNQEETASFISASWDGTVKIWDITSNACKATITMDKHPDPLLCVDYFTGADRHYLITGSKDGTAQIWDLEGEKHIENLQGHAHQISVVFCHPELQKLITGSLDGTVQIWDSTKYRLEKIIAFNLGAVYDFVFIDDENVQRIVVGCQEGIAIMKMNPI